MKTYMVTAKFWRGNPQLKNGGYYTTRNYEVKNEREAMKKVNYDIKHTIYGTFNFIEWIEPGKKVDRDGNVF